MKPFISISRLPALIVIACAISLPASAWEIRSFGGHDYVPVAEVATFYGMREESATDSNSKNLAGTGRSLVLTRGSREVVLNGLKHWLAFPLADDGGRLFLSRLDLGKTVEPAFRPELIGGFPRVTTVVLDAGHGGRDAGARSPYELEKNFALDVARRIRDQLKKSGIRVLMTRNSDVFVELQDRAALANRLQNVIFASIHFNAVDNNPAASGFEIFCVTPQGAPSTAYEQTRLRDMVEENGNEHDIHSFALANTIYHAMHGRLDMADRGVKRARFAVLRSAGVPAVLIEGGFLSNSGDARKIASKHWRDTYASAIACGILEYKKLAEQKIAPRNVAAHRNPNAPAPIMAAAPAALPTATGIMLREIPE